MLNLNFVTKLRLFWTTLREKRTARKEAKDFQAGFNYVVNELAKGRPSAELEIEAHCVFDNRQFDRGILAAVNRERLGLLKSRRG